MSVVASVARGYDVEYYLKCAGKGAEGYYLSAVAEIGEPAGIWNGRGCAELGLDVGAEIDDETMRLLYGQLLDPRDPNFRDKNIKAEDKAALGKPPRTFKTKEEIFAAKMAAKPDATPEQIATMEIEASNEARKALLFLDFTISVSKSVSVVHAGYEAAAQEAERAGNIEASEFYRAQAKTVERIIMNAVEGGLEMLQDEAGYARVGYHGAIPRDPVTGRKLTEFSTGKFVRAKDFIVGSFFQHTSRDGDPQLHVHNLILNRVLCPDGQWRTLDSRAIHKWRAAVSEYVGRQVDEDMTTELGLRSTVRSDGKAREIVGVSEQIRDTFSTRRIGIAPEIRKLADEYEVKWGKKPNARVLFSMGQWATLDRANRKAKKKHAQPREVSLDVWEQAMRAAELGSLADIPNRIEGHLDLETLQGIAGKTQEEMRQVIDVAVAELEAARTWWTRPQLMAEISKALPDYLGGLDKYQIRDVLNELTDNALAPGAGHGVLLLNAPELVATPPERVREEDGLSIYEAHDVRRYSTTTQIDREEQILGAGRRLGAPSVEKEKAAAAFGTSAEELDLLLHGTRSRKPIGERVEGEQGAEAPGTAEEPAGALAGTGDVAGAPASGTAEAPGGGSEVPGTETAGAAEPGEVPGTSQVGGTVAPVEGAQAPAGTGEELPQEPAEVPDTASEAPAEVPGSSAEAPGTVEASAGAPGAQGEGPANADPHGEQAAAAATEVPDSATDTPTASTGDLHEAPADAAAGSPGASADGAAGAGEVPASPVDLAGASAAEAAEVPGSGSVGSEALTQEPNQVPDTETGGTEEPVEAPNEVPGTETAPKTALAASATGAEAPAVEAPEIAAAVTGTTERAETEPAEGVDSEDQEVPGTAEETAGDRPEPTMEPLPLLGDGSAIIDPADLVYEVNGERLRGDQAAAAYGVLTSGSEVDVLVGPAGTGKSMTMGVLSDLWRQETGESVVGVTISQNAADVLAGEGCDETYNIAAFLSAYDRGQGGLRPGQLLVVDEASMVDTAQLSELLRMAQVAGAKVLLTGDPAQLEAVGAGGAFQMLAREHGYFQLTRVARMNEQWEREASLKLRQGDTAVLAEYDKHSRLDEGDLEEMTDKAYRNWLADTLAGHDSILLAPTGDQASELSRRARADLVALDKVDESDFQLRDKNFVGKRDRIMARRNHSEIESVDGRRITNRDVLRVVGWDEQRQMIAQRYLGRDRETGNERWGETYRLPEGYVRNHVELAYAGTVHAAQGRTVDTAHALVQDGMVGRAMLYVMMTRARIANYAYAVTKARVAEPQPDTVEAPELSVEKLRAAERAVDELVSEPAAGAEAPSQEPAEAADGTEEPREAPDQEPGTETGGTEEPVEAPNEVPGTEPVGAQAPVEETVAPADTTEEPATERAGVPDTVEVPAVAPEPSSTEPAWAPGESVTVRRGDGEEILDAEGRPLETGDVLRVEEEQPDIEGRVIVTRDLGDGEFSEPFTVVPFSLDYWTAVGELPAAPEATAAAEDTAEDSVEVRAIGGQATEGETAGQQQGQGLNEPVLDRFSVLGAAMQGAEAEQTALEVIRDEQMLAGHPAKLGAVYNSLVSEGAEGYYDNVLKGVLTEDQYNRLQKDPERPTLFRLVHAADLAGEDPGPLLIDAVSSREFETDQSPARSIAAVLHFRVKQALGTDQPEPRLYERFADRPNRIVDPVDREWAERHEEVLDHQAMVFGEQLAETPPPWALTNLGPVPQDDLIARAEWERRAGIVEVYRQQYGRLDPEDALGRGTDSPEAAVGRKAAYHALGCPNEQQEVRDVKDGELWRRTLAYGRQTEWAPPSVADELRTAGHAVRTHTNRATLADAEASVAGTVEERERLTAVAQGHRDLADQIEQRRQELAEVDAARVRWHTETEQARQAATDAIAELERRHPDAGFGRLHDDPRPNSRAQEEREQDQQREIEGQGALDLGDTTKQAKKDERAAGRDRPVKEQAAEKTQDKSAEREQVAGQTELDLTQGTEHDQSRPAVSAELRDAIVQARSAQAVLEDRAQKQKAKEAAEMEAAAREHGDDARRQQQVAEKDRVRQQPERAPAPQRAASRGEEHGRSL
ncbi:MobF family relaxase [Actinocorallia lasiicapitis]